MSIKLWEVTMHKRSEPRLFSKFIPVFLSATLLAAVFPAQGAVLFQSLGTAAPPTTLGGLPMTPFVQQGNCDSPLITTIPGCPIPGSLTVSPGLYPNFIGCGWATWSHGYTGDVYTDYAATTVTLTLPPGTTAFYLYAEPDPFAIWSITVTTNSGATSGAIPVDGSGGAAGFGFYTNAADTIATITISSGVDFAIGEFGISNAVVAGAATCFTDDWGRSCVCFDAAGNWTYSILMGQGAGSSFSGTGTVTTGTSYQRVISKSGQASVINMTYFTTAHRATATFSNRGLAISSAMYDQNTTNDPPTCGSPPAN